MAELLLAIDSSNQKQSFAVYDLTANKSLAVSERESRSALILPSIKEIFAEHNLALTDLKKIVVCSGPGSFTGIRAALTVVKILAIELSVDVYLLNNFQLLRFVHKTNSAVAFSTLKSDYFISLSEDYSDESKNFFSNENAAEAKLLELPEKNIAEHLVQIYLKEKPQACKIEEIEPYYLRMPNIGKIKKISFDSVSQIYQNALQAYSRAEFQTASTLFSRFFADYERLSEDQKSEELLNNAREIYAQVKLDLGELSAAKRLFHKSSQLAQAAFCAFLAGKINEAKHLYRKAPDSIAKRWGIFLCEYFAPEGKGLIDSPGFIAFRLFAQSSFYYFLQSGLETEIQQLLTNYKNLEKLFPELRKSIAAAYLAQGDAEQALKIFNEASADYPMDAELFYKIGTCYQALGEEKNAIDAYKIVQSLVPGHIASQKILDQLAAQA